MKMPKYIVKETKQVVSDTGVIRDCEDGKINYLLAIDGPMFERYAAHLTKAAKTKGDRNWMNARDEETIERAKRSALRHMIQWLEGKDDEDHPAAIIFNLNVVEYAKEKLDLISEPGMVIEYKA